VGGGVKAMAIAMTKNIHYPNRTIRLSDRLWQKLKIIRRKSGLSWNLFIAEILGIRKGGNGKPK
jgi:predicted DNA-binding ribbon-helix-helix protein